MRRHSQSNQADWRHSKLVIRTPRTYTAVSLNAEILAFLSESVTGETTGISAGFFLVDRADQTEEMPCLTAYWTSCALVFTFSFCMIRYL